MHTYSTPGSRARVYGAMAVPAVMCAWIIVALVSHLNWPTWLVSAPSLTVTYAGIYALVDKVLWKSPAMRRLGLVDIDDLSGTYDGQLVSTYKDDARRQITRDVELMVSQTWSQISVRMEVKGGASSSTSDSATASLYRGGNGTRLAYMYQNRVNPGVADADMADHTGAAELVVTGDGTLTGRYFNSRPRAGTISARKR